MRYFYYLLAFIFISCNNGDKGHVLIVTSHGDIEIELYPDKAPMTVEAFLKNIKDEIYTNASFYRVLKAEQLPSDNNSGIIQGGIYLSGESVKPGFIPHETTRRSGLSHVDATVSMARNAPGTAASEFFICIGDQSPLDSGRRGTPDGLGMAAFGKVVNGMKVVRMIHNEKSTGDSFLKPVVINKIKVL